MVLGDVHCFAEILVEVHQKGLLKADAIRHCDMCVSAKRRGSDRLFLTGQMQLPLPLANGLKMDSQIIEVGLFRIRFVKVPVEEVANILTINHSVGWDRCIGE